MRIAISLVVAAFVLALLSVSPEPAAAHCGGGGVNHGDSQGPPPPDDLDCDFVKDSVDNCPPIGYDDIRTRNPNQEDTDGDGVGDWCQADDDRDGVFDWTDHEIEYRSTRERLDNCRNVANPGQEDDNANGVGNACEFDTDGDGLFDSEDNCPTFLNQDQADLDRDDFGDVCDNDDDGDYTRDNTDNCPRYPNPDQLDADQDGVGAVCDDHDTPPEIPAPAPIPRPSATVAAIDRQPPRGGGFHPDLVPGRRGGRRVDRPDPVLRGLHGEGRGDGVQVGCAQPATAWHHRRRIGNVPTEGATSTYVFVRFNSRGRARLFRRTRTVFTLKVAASDPAGNTRRETEHLVLRLG